MRGRKLTTNEKGSNGIDQEKLLHLFTEVAKKHQLFLEDLKIQETEEEVKLNLVVDLFEDEIGSADLDTVSELSRELSDLLDADVSLIGNGPSELNVSTPGALRPLKKLRHFKRARSRLLKVQLQDGREFHGRLLDVNGEELEFEVKPAPHVPKKKSQAKGQNIDQQTTQKLPKIKPGEFSVAFSEVKNAEVQLEFK